MSRAGARVPNLGWMCIISSQLIHLVLGGTSSHWHWWFHLPTGRQQNGLHWFLRALRAVGPNAAILQYRWSFCFISSTLTGCGFFLHSNDALRGPTSVQSLEFTGGINGAFRYKCCAICDMYQRQVEKHIGPC